MMGVIKNRWWLLFLCAQGLHGADLDHNDLSEPFVAHLEGIDPTLIADSRLSSASSTPVTPTIAIWDKSALSYVMQKQKNDTYRRRKIAFQIGTTLTAMGALVLNCLSDKGDFNPYAIGAAALAVLCNAGTICFDCLIDRNTTMNPMIKPISKPSDLPRDATQNSLPSLSRENTQSSLAPIPEDM